MIKDKKAWEEFERMLINSSKADYYPNLRIFEDLLSYSKLVGKFPPEEFNK